MCSSRQRVAVVLLLAVLLCELSPGAGGRADPGAATFAAAVVPLLGAATQPGPPPAPMPARIPAARQVGAAASLPTKENDGHTPTFAFTVTPKVNPAASYSYDEYVALFGTALQALDLDLVAAFTERLDGDRNGRLVGAEVLALSALLEDEKRAAQQAAEDDPLGLEDFEERYARWLKAGSFRVFEQLDTDGNKMIDSDEIQEVGAFMDNEKLHGYAHVKQGLR